MISFIHSWKNSWKDSLGVFSRDQLTLFSLVVLNTVIRTYKYLFSSLWWLFLAYGVSVIFLRASLPWVPLFLGVSIVFFTFLAVRSSVERKTISYFLFYVVHDYALLFLLFLFPYLISSGIVAQWYTLFFIFLMFFIFDSGMGCEQYALLKACSRTALMLLSNAPLLFMVYGFFLLLFILLHYVIAIPVVYLMALAPIPLSFFSTVYSKRVHEQLTLYV